MSLLKSPTCSCTASSFSRRAFNTGVTPLSDHVNSSHLAWSIHIKSWRIIEKTSGWKNPTFPCAYRKGRDAARLRSLHTASVRRLLALGTQRSWLDGRRFTFQCMLLYCLDFLMYTTLTGFFKKTPVQGHSQPPPPCLWSRPLGQVPSLPTHVR
jgi:hypothetical protein